MYTGYARWSSGCVLYCQVRCPRFKSRPGQKFGSRFLLHASTYSASGTTSQWIVDTRLEQVPSGSEEVRVEPLERNDEDLQILWS